MTATQDDTIAELQCANAELRRERDAARAREATLAEELGAREMALAQRNIEYSERIDHQTATIDVLKAMSASPGDPQPVFNLIAERARDICGGYGVSVHEFDGSVLHLRAYTGVSEDPSVREAYEALYPTSLTREVPVARAIMERRVTRFDDLDADPGLSVVRGTVRSAVAVPMMRGDAPIGGLIMGSRERGGFSATQVELLKTFAEQAVIAITSAETYRSLQTRTSDLQETLEYQTAISDVLKVISRSSFDLQPVLDTLVETAARLCDAEQALISQREGEFARLVANYGFPPEYETYTKALGPFPIDPNAPTVAQRALAEGRLVHVHDVAAIPGYWEVAIRLGKQRTTLGVPLRREGQPIGVILLARQRVEPFTDRQIELVSTFAAQAVIAIENTRLITEQQEALEQQTATAEVLQVINAKPGDLAPVFNAMLEKAMRLCEAAFGFLAIYDGVQFRPAALRGVPDALASYFQIGMDQPRPGEAHWRLLAGEELVHNLDQMDEDAYRSGSPLRRAIVDLGGARSALVVALRKDGVLLGALTIYRKEVRPFSDKQIALLQNFAAQAVVAMENARLITEQREALEQQTAAAEVLQVINASPGNLAPVFSAILEKATRLCDTAFGALSTYDGELWRPAAVHGPAALAEFFMNRPPWRPAPESGIGRHIVGEDIVHFADLAATDLYGQKDPGRSAYVELGQARTAMSVALRKDDILLGAVQVYRQEVRSFDEREIALLQSFAAQAVIAMENARLLTEQREALEQQTATAEVLQVINANPGNLAPVFDAVLEKSLRLCEAEIGVLLTYDGDMLRLVATRGVPPALVDYLMKPHRPPPGGSAHRIVLGENIVHLDDVKDSDAYRSGDEARRAHVDLGGGRTAVYVALRKDNALLGVIVIYRQEVRAFSDKDIALLKNFAAQAVIAMENARLITEQREALEQQTATAEVLQVINASPSDLAPVFDAVLDKALRLCNANLGQLATFDGVGFRAAAWRGFPPDPDRPVATPAPSPGMALYRLIHGEEVLHVTDITDDAVYRSGNPQRRRLADEFGARTAIWVAFKKDTALLGALMIYRTEVRPFSSKQIALLQNFAAQAVIAMENARLITEQREALEQQTATGEVLQVINVSPGDLAPVFDTMLKNALRLCGAAFGTLYTYDGEHFEPVAFRGVAPGFAELMTKYPPTSRPGTPAAQVLETKRPVDVPDATDLETYRRGIAPARELVEVGGVRAFINVPLVKDGQVLGFFTIYRRVAGRLSDKQIALLENFATQVVIAMESARLLHELRARTDELAQRQTELRITFENMGDGVAMFDETQHLVAWNRKFENILDVPDDIIARRQTFSEYVHYLAECGEYGPEADPEEHVRGLIEQAGQSRTYERTRPDGRIIEIRHNPVAGGGFVLIYADITERKRNEAEIRAARDAAEEASRTIEAAYRELKTAQANLIQAEKMASLGQLTAGIAHEIKNPLNFVNNFAELSVDLLGELKDAIAPAAPALTEKQRAEVEEVSVMLTSNLEKITEHGKRADSIVKAMLEHSRGSSGERRMVDLNALIDEALNLAYHGARAQDQSFNITLERDFGEGIAPIEVNPQDITRVFLNLFANGFYATTKRTRDGGDPRFEATLRVTTRDAGEAVEIRVRDNGTGIPADIRDKLFQPFFTTKPTGEGTGLGLSITYDIVTQQHGGNIAVDSKVGDYSEFTIRLPRKP